MCCYTIAARHKSGANQKKVNMMINAQLEENVKEFKKITAKIGALVSRKEELEKLIIAGFGHDKDGQEQYPLGSFKVECKTLMIYSLDKKLYEENKDRFDKKLVKKSTTYTYKIDKKIAIASRATLDGEDRDILDDMITKKPAKVKVTVYDKD
jgi:hypothetical protein